MVAAALLGVGVSKAPQAKAANLHWDADLTAAGNNISNGTGLGGAGTWDTSSLEWFNGTSNQAWSNSSLDVAYFSGTAGVVALGEAITVGGLNFGVTGYSITGNTLTLSPPTGTRAAEVAVTNNGNGTNRATLSSLLAGTSGLTKTGNGTLVLTNSANSFTGDVTVKAGTLVVSANGQLGLGAGPVAAVDAAAAGHAAAAIAATAAAEHGRDATRLKVPQDHGALLAPGREDRPPAVERQAPRPAGLPGGGRAALEVLLDGFRERHVLRREEAAVHGCVLFLGCVGLVSGPSAPPSFELSARSGELGRAGRHFRF